MTLSAASVYAEYITATATDPDGNTSEFSAAVRSTPPSNLNLSAPAAFEGDFATLIIAFTDADTIDTHKAVINWGDGTADTIDNEHGGSGSV